MLCLDFDRYCAFAVGVCNVLVRQLVKIFENFVQRSDEIVIDVFTLCPVGRSVACDLRIEIVIIIAQPSLGIFVVTVANASLPEQVAYEICDALAAREAEIPWERGTGGTAVHMWRESDVPLHPGAERWYREHG